MTDQSVEACTSLADSGEVTLLETVPGIKNLITLNCYSVETLLKQFDPSFKSVEETDGLQFHKQFVFDIEQEYLNVASFVLFFLWLFVLLLVVATVLKWKLLQISVCEANLERQEVILLAENREEIIPSYMKEKETKREENKQQKEEEEQKKEQEEDEDEDSENVIEKNKDGQEQEGEGEKADDIDVDIKDDEDNKKKDTKKETKKEVRKDIDVSEPKQQAQKPADNKNQTDEEARFQKMRPVRLIVKIVEDFIEKYLVLLAINIYLIISFGSYTFTAFFFTCALPLMIAFNSLGVLEDKTKKFSHLAYHAIMLLFYFAYFINTQRYYHKGKGDDARFGYAVK